jgi:hypothetical protein
MVPAQDAERWLQQLEEANGVGEFHTGAIVFSAVGDKPLSSTSTKLVTAKFISLQGGMPLRTRRL